MTSNDTMVAEQTDTRQRWRIGQKADFAAPGFDRALFRLGDQEVGVFRVGGELRAYRNVCPHSGGPVCEGDVRPKLEERPTGEGPGRTQQCFADDQPTLSCPWHGWEFDLSTGRALGDRRVGLRSVRIEEEAGDVYLVL